MKILILLLLALILTGCAAVSGRIARAAYPSNTIGYYYPGLQIDSFIMGSGSPLMVLAMLDSGPTAILDTLLLPYDGICYLIWHKPKYHEEIIVIPPNQSLTGSP